MLSMVSFVVFERRVDAVAASLCKERPFSAKTSEEAYGVPWEGWDAFRVCQRGVDATKVVDINEKSCLG